MLLLTTTCRRARTPDKPGSGLSNTTWFGHNGLVTRCYMGFSGLKGRKVAVLHYPGSLGRTGRTDGTDGTGGTDGTDGTGQARPLRYYSITALRAITG